MDVADMEIRKLKVFLDLAKTLNYSETAARMYTTQGNISKQILSLEKELGVTLFIRAHRKIVLSNEGELVRPYARKIMNDYESLNIKLGDYHDQQRMTLRLLTIPTMPNYQSFVVLSQFLKQHPEVHVSLQEEESNLLFDSLRKNDCDVIFARTFEFPDTDLERLVMEKDDFVAVLPNDHQLADSKMISLEQLKQDNFLLLGETTQLYKPVIAMCKDAGFVPKIAYKGVRADLIVGMIEKGMGVSVMPTKTATGIQSDQVVQIPFKNSNTNQLSFIRKRDHSGRASDVFWKFINDAKSSGEYSN
jgi:DNA-binding transcriptional LysR family regulator